MFQTHKTKGFQKLNTNNKNILRIAQIAYDKYMSFLEVIKQDTRLLEVRAAEGRVIDKGTLLNIKFAIEYVPNGSRIYCETSVLEKVTKAVQILDISCSCCLEWIDKSLRGRNEMEIVHIK